MTVVHTGYLKSHPATKQEAQLKNVEQSAAEDIMNIYMRHSYYETTKKIIEIIRSAVHDSLSSLDFLNSQLFASS